MKFITFLTDTDFRRALTLVELDETPIYEIDADLRRIYSDDILSILTILLNAGEFYLTRDIPEDAEGDDHKYGEYDESMDGDFDSGMASAGFGTDEDYGYFGGED